MLEVAGKLTAWSLPVLARPLEASGSGPPNAELLAAVVEVGAVAECVYELLGMLPQQPVLQLSSAQSSVAFQLLSGCCRPLLGGAAVALQLLQHDIEQRSATWTAQQQHWR